VLGSRNKVMTDLRLSYFFSSLWRDARR